MPKKVNKVEEVTKTVTCTKCNGTELLDPHTLCDNCEGTGSCQA